MLGEKPVLMPLCPPQISHWLALDRAVLSMRRDKQLAARGSEVKKKKKERTFLSNTRQFPKKTILFEVSQISFVCPSGKSSM